MNNIIQSRIYIYLMTLLGLISVGAAFIFLIFQTAQVWPKTPEALFLAILLTIPAAVNLFAIFATRDWLCIEDGHFTFSEGISSFLFYLGSALTYAGVPLMAVIAMFLNLTLGTSVFVLAITVATIFTLFTYVDIQTDGCTCFSMRPIS